MTVTAQEVIEMINKKTFGAFVREKRIEKGLTQKELAEQLFVSESAVSKWEMGKSYPDITLVSDICRILDVSEKELIDGATDAEYRTMRHEAQLFQRISKTYFWVPTICYVVAIVISLVCDLAVNHALTFSPIVFGALLVAFSFIPSWIRFTDEHKLALFTATSCGSLIILFLICCAEFRQTWFGIAALAVILGYVVCFGPLLLKRYLPRRLAQARLLIYFVAVFIVLALLLCVIRITVDFPLGAGLLIVLYAFIPFAVTGLMHFAPVNSFIRAAVDVFAFGIVVFGTELIVGLILGDAQVLSYYQVNYTDWGNCANGNIMLPLFIVCVVIAIVFAVVGLRRNRTRA